MTLEEAVHRLQESAEERRVWRPHFFDATVAAERRALETLLSSGRVRSVNDRLSTQIHELIETRNPRADEAALSRAVSTWTDGRDPLTLGRWIFYPWSGRLLHVLAEPEFFELRTSRNRYKITPDEQRRLAELRIGIVGLSVGHATALTLALEGIGGELRLADFDTLSLSNLNRLSTGLHHLGINKAVLTARELLELNPYAKLRVYEEGITHDNVETFLTGEGGLHLLIEECDDLYMKIFLRERARALRLPVLMETSDRGLIDVERFDLEPDRPLLHGFIGDVRAESLEGLATVDKVPFVLDILGVETLSPRFAASLVEIDRTINTWPQLASGVALGGALNADTARRLALGTHRSSGRFYVDLEALIGEGRDAKPEAASGREAKPEAASGREATRESASGREATRESASGREATRESASGREATRESASGQRNMTPESVTGRATTPEPASARHATPDAAPATARAPPLASRATEPWQRALIQIAEAATLAPSGGNTQPWRFEGAPGVLRCYLDATRASTFLDFEHRASLLACGAAAENAVIAAAGLHLRGTIRWTPGEDSQVWELRLEPDATLAPDTELRLLHQRVTNRRVTAHEPLSADERRALLDAAAERDAALTLVEDPAALEELGRILGATDRLRLLHQRMHTEMMGEVCWTRSEAERRRDGLELRSLELSATDEAGMRVSSSWPAMAFLRKIGGGSALEELAQKALVRSSAGGLLWIRGMGREHSLQGGRALQRVWHAAQARGLSLQPWSALPYLIARVEAGGEGLDEAERETIRSLAERLDRVFGLSRDGVSRLLVFRLGHAGPLSARSLRRPLEEVFSFSA